MADSPTSNLPPAEVPTIGVGQQSQGEQAQIPVSWPVTGGFTQQSITIGRLFDLMQTQAMLWRNPQVEPVLDVTLPEAAAPGVPLDGDFGPLSVNAGGPPLPRYLRRQGMETDDSGEITVPYDGEYEITLRASIDGDAQNRHVWAKVFRSSDAGGTWAPPSHYLIGDAYINSNDDVRTLYLQSTANLFAGDLVVPWWCRSQAGGSNDADIRYYCFAIRRIGQFPEGMEMGGP